MEILNEKIEKFKEKSNRPNAWDEDVKKLLIACGGDVELAVSLITDNPLEKSSDVIAKLQDATDKIVEGYEKMGTNGEIKYMICGLDGITEMRYHYPIGEGDRHFIDVYRNGKLVLREFNFKTVIFKPD